MLRVAVLVARQARRGQGLQAACGRLGEAQGAAAGSGLPELSGSCETQLRSFAAAAEQRVQVCSESLLCLCCWPLLGRCKPQAEAPIYRPLESTAADSFAFGACQLPAQVQGLAGKYAAALYIAGFKDKVLDQIDNDLIEVSTGPWQPCNCCALLY